MLRLLFRALGNISVVFVLKLHYYAKNLLLDPPLRAYLRSKRPIFDQAHDLALIYIQNYILIMGIGNALHSLDD